MIRMDQRTLVALVSIMGCAAAALGNPDSPVCDHGGPYSEWTGCPITFDGSGSSAPGGFIVSYRWDFGDGTTGQGAVATHTYWLDSWNRVILTVTDDMGRASACSTIASVDSDNLFEPLSCDAHGPYASTVGDSVHFVGSAENAQQSPTYEWSFGDGSTGAGPTPIHAYDALGRYTVLLEVNDLLPVACHLFPRDASCETSVVVDVNPVDTATWGAIKALYK